MNMHQIMGGKIKLYKVDQEDSVGSLQNSINRFGSSNNTIIFGNIATENSGGKI